MKYIVAVSGGVDSVVLLDMLASQYGPDELVVAHFEHGIRGEDSKADARFVEELSKKYRVDYEIGRGDLSKTASESQARKARYEFLRKVAKKHGGTIVTAHHQDDLIETIALNISRGTGWRGLAVFGDNTIERPLLHLTKRSMYDYVLDHELEWVEDETNQTPLYMRNRLRSILGQFPEASRRHLVKLYEEQTQLHGMINSELAHFDDQLRSRYFMTMVPENIAVELLRYLTGARLTRPQMKQLLLAIKTARAGTESLVGSGISVKFTAREFSLESLWSH